MRWGGHSFAGWNWSLLLLFLALGVSLGGREGKTGLSGSFGGRNRTQLDNALREPHRSQQASLQARGVCPGLMEWEVDTGIAAQREVPRQG